MPALTLGCGAVGGSSTSDNIGPANLFNIRRVAYGVRELEELRGSDAPCTTTVGVDASKEDLIDVLVEKVLAQLQ